MSCRIRLVRNQLTPNGDSKSGSIFPPFFLARAIKLWLAEKRAGETDLAPKIKISNQILVNKIRACLVI